MRIQEGTKKNEGPGFTKRKDKRIRAKGGGLKLPRQEQSRSGIFLGGVMENYSAGIKTG